MKKVHLLLTAFLFLCGMPVMAQQDFSSPQYARWGETPEARQENIMSSNFLAESVKNRKYDEAAVHLNALIAKRPEASVNTFKYGKIIYRSKISRAEDAAQRNVMIDSLLMMYDLQAQYFGDGKESASDLFGNKAKELLLYRSGDREAIREAFKQAIVEGGANTSPEILTRYFQNLCDDYQNGEVHPDEVIVEYERIEPLFADRPEAVDGKRQFDYLFGASGVASCDNLERIFAAKLQSAPNDAAILAQAVTLMSRADCSSPFFFDLAERYYAANPSAETAMMLAQAFQNEGAYDKAVQYLREALNEDQHPAEREKLLVHIGVVEMIANRVPQAASAVRQALELNPENGLAYFVLAQCYAASAANCSGIDAAATFWAAYDTMNKAINYMSEEDEATYGMSAKATLAAYRNRFPTAEECFFNEMRVGERYTVNCGTAAGVSTTVRVR